jgi:hypothetical protein
MNQDTLFSAAVIDTSKSATITLSRVPVGRFNSAQVDDHYCPADQCADALLDVTPGCHFVMHVYRPGPSAASTGKNSPRKAT